MNDCLTDATEEGYQAFLSGESIDSNPYSMEHAWVNHHRWEVGWNTAASENSVETTCT